MSFNGMVISTLVQAYKYFLLSLVPIIACCSARCAWSDAALLVCGHTIGVSIAFKRSGGVSK